MLTTGVDAPMVKNVVLARVVGSMTEFKQIIGRGRGCATTTASCTSTSWTTPAAPTRLFADPEFDGDPALIVEETMDAEGQTVPGSETTVQAEDAPSAADQVNAPAAGYNEKDIHESRQKFYFDGGRVEISNHLVYDMAPDGTQLRVVKFSDYTAENVRSMYTSSADLRQRWADPVQRAAIIAALDERGIRFDELAEATHQPDADPFDLLCHVAFNAPLRTRRERANALRQQRGDFFAQYGPEARAILSDLLDKYAEHGTAQFRLPDVLKVPPVSQYGNTMEVASFFGGAEKLRDAVVQLQTLLYSA